jgi:2-aminoadipate transaminase
MFVWAEGPRGLDMEIISKITLNKGVGFVPGKFFYPNPADGIETMRLNFTSASIEKIYQAIKILGNTCYKYLLDHKV